MLFFLTATIRTVFCVVFQLFLYVACKLCEPPSRANITFEGSPSEEPTKLNGVGSGVGVGVGVAVGFGVGVGVGVAVGIGVGVGVAVGTGVGVASEKVVIFVGDKALVLLPVPS